MTEPGTGPRRSAARRPTVRRFGRAAVGAALAAALAATACGAPGGEKGGPDRLAAGDGITEPVTAEQVAELGDITLRIGLDANVEAEMKRLIPRYEKKYPNVTVEVKYKSFEDQTTTVVPTLQSGGAQAPDIVHGNQGYSVDGALVKGGLVRPIDDLAKTYGWAETFSPSLQSTLRWSETGDRFGSGDLYGIAPDTQNVGVFYNKKKLRALGVEPPETFEAFEKALEAAKDDGEQPMILGNAEGYGAYQVYGIILAARSEASALTEWINGTEGADFVSAAGAEAADRLVEWEKAGYFQEGYNSLADVDATTRFGEGDGVFMIAGDWNTTSLVQAGAEDIGFLPAPKGASGAHIAQGAAGLPLHVNAKTENIEAVAAFLAMVMDEQNLQDLAELGRVTRVPPENMDELAPLTRETIEATRATLDDDALVGFLDYASDSMYDTLGKKTQELMGGEISTDDYLADVQRDWQEFRADRS